MSLRTAAEPMAFGSWEFWRGAILAVIFFLLLAPWVLIAEGAIETRVIGGATETVWSDIPAMLLYVPLFATPWALGALFLVGAPVAFVLGRALRREVRRGLHLIAFGALGAVVGAATTILWQLWSRMPAPGVTIVYQVVRPWWEETDWAMVAGMAAATATAVMAGWWVTVRGALRADAQ